MQVMSHVYAFGGEGLLPGLAARGYMPDDITDVVLTHLHFDHCGGGIFGMPWKIAAHVSKCRYHVSAEQWDWATHPTPGRMIPFLPKISSKERLGALHWLNPRGVDTRAVFEFLRPHPRTAYSGNQLTW
jgi:glyoxylase-like metal-dependent hydrolase (beta-lactamase superfamily II)